MKKVLLTLFLICSIHLFPQYPSIKIGETKISELGSDYIPFIGADSQAFYTSDYYEDLTSNFTITKYSSKEMNIIDIKKIQVPVINDNKTCVKKVLLIDGKLILFASQYDKTNNVNRLYAININSDNKLEQSYKLISEIKTIDKKLKGFFNVTLTEDKESLIILSELPSAESDKIRYSWQIMDKNLNILWNKSINLPYYGIASDLVAKMEYRNEKIYFIVTNLKDDITIKKKINGVNKLYCYDLKTSKLTELLLNIQSKSLFDLNINFNQKNHLVLTGLYSYSKVIDKQVFFNHTRELRTENGAFCEVYSENLENILYKDSLVSTYGGFEYYLNDVFIQNDGSIFLVSENREVIGSKNGSSDYYSGGVKVHYFNSDTKVKWMKDINKNQHEVVEGGCYYYFSTLSLIKNNNLFLIINDNKNNNLESSKYNFENFQLVKNIETKIIKINESGNIQTDKSIDDFIDSKNVVYCKTKSRINEIEIIVGSKGGNGKTFAKISLK